VKRWKSWDTGDTVTVMVDVDAREFRYVFNGDYADTMGRMVVIRAAPEEADGSAAEGSSGTN